MRFMFQLLWSACALAVVLPSGGSAGETGAQWVQQRETIPCRQPAVREASGLAMSRRLEGWFWWINDSGSAPVLYLTGPDGGSRGNFQVDAGNTDWEDLSSFVWKGESYLIVGDTGDNLAKRDFCTLYVLAEPDREAMGSGHGGRLKPAWTIRFRYPGGPRDCEAVAVDPVEETILLMSKRTQPPELYQLPLRPDGGEVLTVKKLGVTNVAAPDGARVHAFGGQPTAMDVSADGRRAVVLTYDGVFVFDRKAGEGWAGCFARPAGMFAQHRLVQAECVAFSKDSRSLYVASEGADPLLIHFKQTP